VIKRFQVQKLGLAEANWEYNWKCSSRLIGKIIGITVELSSHSIKFLMSSRDVIFNINISRFKSNQVEY